MMKSLTQMLTLINHINKKVILKALNVILNNIKRAKAIFDNKLNKNQPNIYHKKINYKKVKAIMLINRMSFKMIFRMIYKRICSMNNSLSNNLMIRPNKKQILNLRMILMKIFQTQIKNSKVAKTYKISNIITFNIIATNKSVLNSITMFK